ncbi:hypothetical protein D6C77_04533 [Aureobasidium pullulans]|nr:hypothetical protein D6C77_04533 [Aureobasidium pullulans]
MASQLLPLELIDKCVGSRIWVIMKGDKGADYTGTSTKMSKILLNGNNICMVIPFSHRRLTSDGPNLSSQLIPGGMPEQ